MLNTLVEQWFDEGLRIPYAELISVRRVGLPTVRLEVDFKAISRHGEVLTQRLQLQQLGRSSMSLQIDLVGPATAPTLRLRARQVLVCTSLLSHRPQALPDDVRAALMPFLAAAVSLEDTP